MAPTILHSWTVRGIPGRAQPRRPTVALCNSSHPPPARFVFVRFIYTRILKNDRERKKLIERNLPSAGWLLQRLYQEPEAVPSSPMWLSGAQVPELACFPSTLTGNWGGSWAARLQPALQHQGCWLRGATGHGSRLASVGATAGPGQCLAINGRGCKSLALHTVLALPCVYPWPGPGALSTLYLAGMPAETGSLPRHVGSVGLQLSVPWVPASPWPLWRGPKAGVPWAG